MMSAPELPDHPHNYPTFPQELFNRFIDLVQVDTLRHPALLNFSLVSKAWAHHSRKRIFSQVKLTSKTHFKLWCKNTAPGPGGPSSLTQVLFFSQLKGEAWIRPSVLLEEEDHLVSFTNLKGFVVFNLKTFYFKDRELLSRCFRVIGRDLHFARLHHVQGTPKTLKSFIQRFPTTKTLAIEYYKEVNDFSPAEEPDDDVDCQFRGCLRLLSIAIDGLEGLAVIDSIARLPLKYEEVHLTSSLHFVEAYNRLFSACASTLERLRIIDTRKPRSHWAIPIDSRGITVASCTELQTVRLGTSKNPGPMLNRFLESIDSLNLRELAFELIWDKYTDDDISSVINIPVWEPIDDVLCSLARRIRVTHPERRLSVVLSLVAPQTTDLGKVKLGSLFRKFREEGTINLQYFIDHLPPGVYSPDMPLLAVTGGPQ